MKKNKAMRAAGVLVIATLLTTCLTAGTFAKYTTTDSATDSARVAKFGVTVVANGSLYGNAYTKADTNTPEIQTNDNKDTITVKAANNTDKVVAPGTKNDSGIGFAVNGTPEVDVRVHGEVTAKDIFLAANTYGVMVKKPAGVVTAENFTKLTTGNNAEELYTLADGTYTKAIAYADNTQYYVLTNKVTLTETYYPVFYTLDGDTNATGTAANVAAAVAAKLADNAADTDDSTAGVKYEFNKTVKNNKNLADELKLGSEKIKWAWTFEKDDTTDAKDTILGDLQAQAEPDTTFTNNGAVVKLNGDKYVALVNGTDYNLETGFGISVTVDQVD